MGSQSIKAEQQFSLESSHTQGLYQLMPDFEIVASTLCNIATLGFNRGHRPIASDEQTMNNDILKTLLTQEDELQLRHFNNQTAWELGNLIKSAADQNAAPIAIEIYAFEQVLFSYFMPGTNKDNQDWINRKRQSVMRFSHSSYYTGQYNAIKNRDFETIPHLDPKQYCAHGGSFPLRIKNSGLIGAVTVSGLAQEVDHQMVIDALRKVVMAQTGMN